MLDVLATFLISPLGTTLAFGLFSFVLYKYGKQRLGRVTGWLSVIWLIFFSLPVISHSLRSIQEAGFPPIAVEKLPKKQAIVVLGGAMRPAVNIDGLPDLRDSADRVWHAARLFHAGRAPLVVLSGGSDLNVRAYPEAEAMKVFLLDLGLPENALVLEPRSRNTRQNAEYTADLLLPMGVKDILLVTSAMHMRRSVSLFESRGFNVTAAATDYAIRRRFGWNDIIPKADSLDESAKVIKEIVGFYFGR